ncbi:MAG TPA: GDP-L-fucose synthase family protein [Candidatus Brocadiaceae bacterium]
MSVLLTGASGMVGRNFLEHPEACNFEILAPSGSGLNLLDYATVKEYLINFKPDIVIHAAGKVGGIQANIREPVRFLLENLDMGRNLVWAAHETGIKKLINIGSSCMYPRNAPNPLKEDMILHGELEPTNEGYALAKIAVARLCEYIVRENPEYQYKTLIPCNLYGRWDKFDPSNSHLVPAIIKKVHDAIIANGKEVGIWSSGTARREFMYAGDMADCLVHAIRNFNSLPLSMNVGLGYDYTIDEYYRITAEVIGFKGKFVHDLSKPEGMRQKLVDVSRLKSFGWQAKTSLEEGIEKTYKFYLERGIK